MGESALNHEELRVLNFSAGAVYPSSKLFLEGFLQGLGLLEDINNFEFYNKTDITGADSENAFWGIGDSYIVSFSIGANQPIKYDLIRYAKNVLKVTLDTMKYQNSGFERALIVIELLNKEVITIPTLMGPGVKDARDIVFRVMNTYNR